MPTVRGCVAPFGAAAALAVWFVAAPAPAPAVEGNPHNLGFCSACHPAMPRFGIDARRDVTFTAPADDPVLCRQCHDAGDHAHPVLLPAGSGPAGARLSAYLPAGASPQVAGKIVCTTCHFIHAADTRSGLLRGFPGSPDPRYFPSAAAFCDECHGGNLATRTAHRGGAASCVFCHGGRPAKGWMAVVAPSFAERCRLCHAQVRADHCAGAAPLAPGEGCLPCHDPHAAAADAPALLSAAYRDAAAASVRISPHFRRGFCFACHESTEGFALRSADVNALCDRCHASGQIRGNIHPLRAVPASFAVPRGWPLTGGALTCLTCHDQGHEDQPRGRWMLHGGPYASSREVCRLCHRPGELAASRVHLEINQGKACELCHVTRPVPGKDTIKTVTFIADPNLLCLRCHEETALDPTGHHTVVMERGLEGGSVTVDLPLYQGRVICATCHNPHQREPDGYRLRAYLADSEFCVGCHAK